MAFFKKFRLFSWTTKAFFDKYGRTILISIFIGIVGFFLVSKVFPFLPSPRGRERIAKIGRSDPDNLPQEILKYLSIGLTTVAEDGSPAPGLAESWEISDDGLTYTFTLAENIFWQDETLVKAEDIKLNFTDVEQETVDERTIKLKLKEPLSPFLTILSKPVFKKGYLGVGPYKIKRIKKNANLVEKITLSGPEKELVFRFYPTQESAVLGFKLGEVDILDEFFSDQLEKEWQKNIEIEEKISKDRYLGVFFNTQYPMFSDKVIRQALAYSIVDKSIDGERAMSPISSDSWAYNPDIKPYQYDAVKAQELFENTPEEDDEAEDKDEEETYEDENRVRISTTEPFLEIAEQIKKSWEEVLGLEVDIELINMLSPDYQIFLGIQEIPDDPDQYVLWHSTRAENITNFKSPKIDKLLEDGRKIADIEERKEKYFDFQKALVEESPVVFLSYPKIHKIKRKRFFNF